MLGSPCRSRRCTFPSRWPTSTSEKPETDNWDAWAAQPSLTVPSAGQLRQRSAFTPATATGSSPSPVLGQVTASLGAGGPRVPCEAERFSQCLSSLSFGSKPWESPGSPVVRTLLFHCRGLAFNAQSGNEDPASHIEWQKKNVTLIICIWVGWQARIQFSFPSGGSRDYSEESKLDYVPGFFRETSLMMWHLNSVSNSG